MKTLVTVTITAIFLTAFTLSAQTPPTPPTPPSTSTTYSVTQSTTYTNSSSNHDSGSSSISVKKTNSTFKFRASYRDKLTNNVSRYLQDNLDGMKFTNTNNLTFWKIEKNDEEAFKCKVSEGGVRIFVDRDLTSRKFQNKIEKIVENLKYIVNNEDPTKAKKKRVKEAEKALELAKEAYKRATR
ncbi:hypothetical protein F7018_15785 [Tenacibaculum aiptasiae]|uniref:Uncharacterized protein n=1 Tax=Tenacibaculum aiptasiae TaxID=426481 RepID=A0A7J5A8T2_9FLAO|nr:hypothetical protein [Tenacibaculum aiptasiae]KAB1153945.1 hypothetical protein F7018_15785 [Tenacibaculum aiptasiae]